MPPPPSVVVDHAYIPVRAGGITAASLSSVDVTANASSSWPVAGAKSTASSADSAPLSPKQQMANNAYADADSRQSSLSSANGSDDGKKVSSSDLKALYRAELSMPPSLSNNASVGLERLKRTSRARLGPHGQRLGVHYGSFFA